MSVDRDDHKTSRINRVVLQQPGDPNLVIASHPKAWFQMVHTAEASVARVDLEIGYVRKGVNVAESIIVTGTAKVMPGDTFDAEIATKLALGRALEKASKKLIRQSQGRMRHLEDSKAKSKESKKKRKNYCDKKKAIADAKRAEKEEIISMVRAKREAARLEESAKRPVSNNGKPDTSSNGKSSSSSPKPAMSATDHGLTKEDRHRADI